MKIAILAITKHGVVTGRRLAEALPGSELWVSEKQAAQAPSAKTFPQLKTVVAELWDKVDGLVMLVSLGAVVRTIAPFLKSKDEDPAVVVVDEACRYSIPVLSGHVGGANELSERVAALLGAEAVLTTASDALATIPVDILGRDLGWRLEGKDKVTAASAAVVNGEPVAFIQECGESAWWTRPSPLPGNIRLHDSIAAALAERADWGALLLVSDRATPALAAELGAAWARSVCYRPRTLCLGMGCDRGTPLEELQALVRATFEAQGLSTLSIASLASLDLKADEPGLIALAGELGVPFITYPKEELNAIGVQSPANPKVEQHTGAVGVSEPAALRSAQATSLCVAKQKGSRCTLAVARKDS